MSMRKDEREFFREKREREFFRPRARFQGVHGTNMMGDDEDGDEIFYGPPENDYGLWREDQFDNLITKCTVNPFVPLGMPPILVVYFMVLKMYV